MLQVPVFLVVLLLLISEACFSRPGVGCGWLDCTRAGQGDHLEGLSLFDAQALPLAI